MPLVLRCQLSYILVCAIDLTTAAQKFRRVRHTSLLHFHLRPPNNNNLKKIVITFRSVNAESEHSELFPMALWAKMYPTFQCRCSTDSTPRATVSLLWGSWWCGTVYIRNVYLFFLLCFETAFLNINLQYVYTLI